MRASKYKQGDIVEIPHPSGKRFVGWVLYMSDYFKDLICVSVYGEAPFDVTSIGTASPAGQPIYTNVIAAKHYGWVTIAHREVKHQDLMQTERIVGGEVFVGDECVRNATDADKSKLPRMLSMGMPVVYDQLTNSSKP